MNYLVSTGWDNLKVLSLSKFVKYLDNCELTDKDISELIQHPWQHL
jgi:hypothetical protein